MNDDDDVIQDVDYGFQNDEDTPAPDVSGLTVLFHRVLVMPLMLKRKTKSGIIIPQQATDSAGFLQHCGKVLVIGESAFTNPELGVARKSPPAKVPKVGDFIIYRRNSGQRLNYKGVKLLLLAENDFITRIDDPESLRIGV